MSSHHFVKEGQEPALLITDPFSPQDIGDLLEWAPLVIALAPSFESIASMGIKADLAFLSEEERRKTEQMMPSPVIEVITTAPFQEALEYLKGHHQRHVNIWTSDPAAYFSPSEKHIDRLEISIISEETKWSCIRSGRFYKWLPRSTSVRYRGREVPRLMNGDFDTTGIITVQKEGILEINSTGFFWVGESRK